MRFALIALALAACDPYPPDPGPYPGGDDVAYYPDAAISNGYACEHDTDCIAGDLCADTRECVPSDQAHRVSVHWTVNGQPPTDASCTSSPYLELTVGAGPTFSPIRCAAGTFTFLKLPDYDTTVYVTASTGAVSTTGSVPVGGGDVTVDLTL